MSQKGSVRTPWPLRRTKEFYCAIKISNRFTIVELLIVIVVIAVLATISVVAYTGVQDRAQQSKIKQI